jgi:hypothetical protein
MVLNGGKTLHPLLISTRVLNLRLIKLAEEQRGVDGILEICRADGRLGVQGWPQEKSITTLPIVATLSQH